MGSKNSLGLAVPVQIEFNPGGSGKKTGMRELMATRSKGNTSGLPDQDYLNISKSSTCKNGAKELHVCDLVATCGNKTNWPSMQTSRGMYIYIYIC